MSGQMVQILPLTIGESCLCHVCLVVCMPCGAYYYIQLQKKKVVSYGTGSALHWACFVGSREPAKQAVIIDLLLRHGADTALKSSEGFTAYDIAIKKLPGLPAELFARLKPADSMLAVAPVSADMKRDGPEGNLETAVLPFENIAAVLVAHSIDAADAPRLARMLIADGFKTPERVLFASDEALKRAGFTGGDIEAFKYVMQLSGDALTFADLHSRARARVPMAAVAPEM